MHDVTPSSPTRSIFCVGKNYPEHAREMAAWEPTPHRPHQELHNTEPIIFMKPGSALSDVATTSIPRFEGHPVSENLHYEGELVLLVGRDADEVPLDNASSYIAGYAAGLDMTLRDVQLEARKGGNPWLKSKGFRKSALISKFIAPEAAEPLSELLISLKLNGEQRQRSAISAMSFSPSYLISYLSSIYGLRAGDLIFTGTPAGVGSVRSGDRIEVSVETAGKEHGQPTRLVWLEATVS